MKRKLYILIPVLCLLNLAGKAQYFSNRYDTFGSCDGAGDLDTIANNYITANFTCSSISFYALNLKLYSFNTGIVDKSKTYHWPGNNFGAANGFKIHNKFLLSGSRFYGNDTSLVFQWTFDRNLDSIKYKEFGFLNQGNVVRSIVYDHAKNYYMAGNVYDINNNSDILLIKTDTAGNEIWKKKIGIPNWDETALTIDTLNGKLVIGGVKGFHGGFGADGIVILVDTAGNVIWQRIISSNGGYGGCYIKSLKDGTILAHNRVKKHNVGSYDYYKLKCEKIDITNNTIWAKEYFPLAEIGGASIIENNDGDIVICGQKVFTDNTVSGNVYVINQNGDSLLYKEFRILPNSQNYFRDVVQAPDKGYCFSGFVSPMNGDGGTQDIWLLKVDSNFCESNASCITGIPDPDEAHGIRIFPNPTADELQIAFENSFAGTLIFELSDAQGRTILKNKILNTTVPHHISLSNIAEGVYFYRLSGGTNFLKTGKIVVIK